MDYKLQVFKKDSRSRTGERLVKEIAYPDSSGNAMMDEVKYARSKYPPEKGYRLDFDLL